MKRILFLPSVVLLATTLSPNEFEEDLESDPMDLLKDMDLSPAEL